MTLNDMTRSEFPYSPIYLSRGNTGKIEFQRLDPEGNPILVQASEIYFTVKKDFRDTFFLLQKTLDDMTFDSQGIYRFTIEPECTENLDFGNYVYDIKVIASDGVSNDVETIALSPFIVGPVVTP